MATALTSRRVARSSPCAQTFPRCIPWLRAVPYDAFLIPKARLEPPARRPALTGPAIGGGFKKCTALPIPAQERVPVLGYGRLAVPFVTDFNRTPDYVQQEAVL